MNKITICISIFIGLLLFSAGVYAKMHQKTEDGEVVCAQISKDIEALKPDFPQLKDFQDSTARRDCTIDYTYHVGKLTGGAGWRGATPKPDPDGVWLHLELWDENSPNVSQLNLQRVEPPMYIGSHRVTLVVLDGENTKSLYESIQKILLRNGLKE